MKKILLFLSVIFLVVGCGKVNQEDLISELNKKIDNSNNYQMVATLEIWRNEDKFTYDVISTYKKDKYFKVSLTNKENNHQQIILRDENSVYVLTPSLNKSFKFQSEWPYNNSQIYLLQPIITDVKNDSKSSIQAVDGGYIVSSSVNYSSEKEFISQKIYFDSNKNITKVEIVDKNDTIRMCLNIISVEYDIQLEDDYFNINKYQSSSLENNENNKSSQNQEQTTNLEISEVLYPMYVPTDTYLTGQNIVSTEIGERIILTFAGESNFTLIQENINNESLDEYIYGEPYLILDTVGAITDYSVTWISDGIEYSVISETMSVDELLTVAQSINVKTVGK